MPSHYVGFRRWWSPKIVSIVSSILLCSSLLFANICLADGLSSLLPSWTSGDHDNANSNNQLQESILSPLTIKQFGLNTQLVILPGAQSLGSPIVSSDNIAYFGDGSFFGYGTNGNVYAVNILTGKMIFNVHVSNAYFNNFPLYGTNAYNFPQTFLSSPVLVGHYLFIADGNGVLYKLDRFTGAIVSRVTIGTPLNGVYDLKGADYGYYPVNGSLLFANHVPAYTSLGNLGVVDRSNEGKPPLIVFGLTSGDSSELGAAASLQTWEHSGAMVGVNAQTMQIEWLTSISPYGGGDNIWGPPAIDQQRHRIYIGVGNLHTPPVSAKTRISPDYSDSLIAINYDTGQIVDHVQFTKGDMLSDLCYDISQFDGNYSLCNPSLNPPNLSLVPTPDNWTSFINYSSKYKYIINGLIPPATDVSRINDVASPPNLFTITVNGKSVDVVGVDDKFGTYAVFNRDNLSQMYWATPSVGANTFNVPASSPTAIAGGAIDYQHHLIWVATNTYFGYTGDVVSYVQAMDMNTGAVKASFQVPVPAGNPYSSVGAQVEGLMIANNVLYLSDDETGALSLYDISNPYQPKLISQPYTPDGSGSAYWPSRNVAVVNGHIIEAVSDFTVFKGGLIIYTLKLPK